MRLRDIFGDTLGIVAVLAILIAGLNLPNLRVIQQTVERTTESR